MSRRGRSVSQSAPAPPDVAVSRARSAGDPGLVRRGSLGALRRWFSNVGRKEKGRGWGREQEVVSRAAVGDCLEVVYEGY